MSNPPREKMIPPLLAERVHIQGLIMQANGAMQVAELAVRGLVGRRGSFPPGLWGGVIQWLCEPFNGTVCVLPDADADHAPWKKNQYGEIEITLLAEFYLHSTRVEDV